MTIARLSFFVGRRSQNFLEEILCYRLNRKTLKTNTSFVLILRKLRANEVKFRRKTCTVESPYLSCTRISPNPKKKLIRFEKILTTSYLLFYHLLVPGLSGSGQFIPSYQG